MIPFILASTSQNRRDLLDKMGIVYEAQAPDYEEVIDISMPPKEQIQDFARGKALSVYTRRQSLGKEAGDFLILGCDSMISFEGQSIGKPRDRSDAFTQLSRFRGKSQEIMSGCALLGIVGGKYVEKIFYESTPVQFRSDITDEQIEQYLAFGDWEGKCGAYSILGTGIYFLESIDGDFQNIIGIPILKLGAIIRDITGKSPLEVFKPQGSS